MLKTFSILILLAFLLMNCDSFSTNGINEITDPVNSFSLDPELIERSLMIKNKLSEDRVVRIVEKDLNDLAAKHPQFGGIFVEVDKNGLRQNDRLVVFYRENNPSFNKKTDILHL
jgi:hypothetical protein